MDSVEQAVGNEINAVLETIRRDNVEAEACNAIDMDLTIAVGERRAGWKKRVFWTSLALSLKHAPSWDVPTMATDGVHMYFNPGFTMGLTADERYGVVIGHEPMHDGFEHFSRMMTYENRTLVNICQDAEINPILRDAGFVLPDGAVFPGEGEYKCLPLDNTAEVYYDILTKEVQAGNRPMPGGEDPGGCGVAVPAPDPATAEEKAAKWRSKVAAAALDADRRGEMPGSLKRWVANILDPQLTWQEELLEFMTATTRCGGENNWSRPSRRTVGSRLSLPERRQNVLPEIVVSVDVSGSTWGFLESFSAELNGVLECNPAKVHLVYSDSSIQKVEEWEPGDDSIEIEAIGGGGTSHLCLWKWLAESDIDPACVIALTDGDTRFGNDPGVPVLWALTKEKEVPFGRKVVIT